MKLLRQRGRVVEVLEVVRDVVVNVRELLVVNVLETLVNVVVSVVLPVEEDVFEDVVLGVVEVVLVDEAVELLVVNVVSVVEVARHTTPHSSPQNWAECLSQQTRVHTS